MPPGAHRPPGQPCRPLSTSTVSAVRQDRGPCPQRAAALARQEGVRGRQEGQTWQQGGREEGGVRAGGHAGCEGCLGRAGSPTTVQSSLQTSGCLLAARKLPRMTPRAEALPLPPICEMGRRRPAESAPQTPQPV